MAVVPHTIDLVVRDMARSLDFYRSLGLAVPTHGSTEEQVQIGSDGLTVGLITEKLMKEVNPEWLDSLGSRMSFACRCDSPAEVDTTYERVTAAGFTGRQAPWDAFWGQRYAILLDPDGNRVDLFSALAGKDRE